MYEEFLRQFWADCDQGQPAPLATYMASFPGLAELIREEYRAWRHAANEPSSAPLGSEPGRRHGPE
jgi:hypothetical protein